MFKTNAKDSNIHIFTRITIGVLWNGRHLPEHRKMIKRAIKYGKLYRRTTLGRR